MAETASQRLNYLDKKARAVSSKASRNIIPCSNGQTFQMGQTARIDLAGNQMATYWDAQNSYLKFTVNNKSDTDIRIESAWALIDRLELLADGQQVSNISNYGALIHKYLDTEVGEGWKENFGRSLAGTSFNANELEIIGDGEASTFCIPLPLNVFFNSSKYIPMMGRSTLSYRITFADVAKGTIGSATNAQITISPIEFVASYIRLSADANAMVMANTGGRFEIIASDTRVVEGNITSGDNALSVNCGFSFSSLDRVSFGFYTTLNDAAKLSVSNRASLDLVDYSLSVNGEEHPRKRIQVSSQNVAETVAEIGIASRSLADFNHQSSLLRYNIAPTDGSVATSFTDKFYASSPTGAEANAGVANFEENRGTFVAQIDTESMKPHADPEALYSGLSTLGSVVQLVGTFDTASENAVCLVSAQYTLAMTLDMAGSQTWIVSI